MPTFDDFFAIHEDAARRLVRLKLRGLWTREIFDQYRTQVLGALRRVKAASPAHDPVRM